MKIIFLNSYSPRTGHNFVAQVIQKLTNCQIIPHIHSESKLSYILNSYYKICETSVNSKTDQNFLDDLFLKDLRSKILDRYGYQFNNSLMIKDTSQVGAIAQKKVFPDDIHILMFRDPRDTLLSVFKAMNYFKKGKISGRLKKLGIYTGVYSYLYSIKYSRRISKSIPKETSGFYILRYEALVNRDEESLNDLIHLFGSDLSVADLKKRIDEIGIINTSFYKEESGGNSIWDQKNKSKHFKPVTRNKNIPFLHKKGIEYGSFGLRRRLGYI